MSENLMRVKQLAAYLGVHRDTIYEMRHRGDLPKPVQITPRVVGWYKDEVDEFFRNRRAKR